MKLIGVHGLSRAGKDTIADYLVWKYGFVKMAFADALKEACAVLLDRPLVQMYSGDREAVMPEWGFSIRWFLQKMGTEAVRDQIDKYFWIKRLGVKLSKLASDTKVVISDVRFEDEALYIREFVQGGKIIIVEKSGLARMDHASEAGIQKNEKDSVIYNDGSLKDLYVKVDEVMRSL